jgi:hypothetical protein
MTGTLPPELVIRSRTSSCPKTRPPSLSTAASGIGRELRQDPNARQKVGQLDTATIAQVTDLPVENIEAMRRKDNCNFR